MTAMTTKLIILDKIIDDGNDMKCMIYFVLMVMFHVDSSIKIARFYRFYEHFKDESIPMNYRLVFMTRGLIHD